MKSVRNLHSVNISINNIKILILW